MDIKSDLSLWYIPLCLLIGIGFAWALYRKNRLLGDASPKAIIGLAALRGTTVSLLCFLLLDWFFLSATQREEPPLVVLAHDNSSSIGSQLEKDNHKTAHLENWAATSQALSKDHQVQELLFGATVRHEDSLSFEDKETDMKSLFDRIRQQYEGRNLQAIVLASDGIYNRNQHPLRSAQSIGVPIHIIALGDTAALIDARVSDVRHNQIAYAGNSFSADVFLAASELKNSPSTLRIIHRGETIFEKPFTIDQERWSQKASITLPAAQPGVQKYTVSIDQLPGERTHENNTMDFYVDVVDGKQRIALVARSPHPDVHAILRALQKKEGYAVDLLTTTKVTKANWSDYDLAILHQISAPDVPSSLTTGIQNSPCPVFLIMGPASDPQQLSRMNWGPKINAPRRNTMQEFTPDPHPDFELFALSKEAKDFFQGAPPLQSFFGQFEARKGTHILFRQRIGNIATQQPLMGFEERNGKKMGWIVGSNLWRWKLHEYATRAAHDYFEEILLKSVQYLCAKSDRNPFRIKQKRRFTEDENIWLEAEVYNASYEPVNDGDVFLKVSGDSGTIYEYTFGRAGDGYRLNAGKLPPGDYTYEATTTHAGQAMSKKGKFTVASLHLEMRNLQANHQLLRNIAVATNGRTYSPQAMSELTQDIIESDRMSSIVYEEVKQVSLLHWKWIGLLIIALTFAEWLFRKRLGAY